MSDLRVNPLALAAAVAFLMAPPIVAAVRSKPHLATQAASVLPGLSLPSSVRPGGVGPGSAGPGSVVPQQAALPASGNDALARLEASPRHGEWDMIHVGADSLRAWVVYPERADKAPVILVVHEIFGMSNWIRAVADQFAAAGFIAVAPDLLTMKNLPMSADGETDPQAAVAAIRALDKDTIQAQLKAVAQWAMNLPAAQKQYGVVGFCWGGGVSFAHAVAAPDVKAAVVFYGVSPPTAELARVRAPVLGLYGGDDARVDATVPAADSAMKAMHKVYEHHAFPGAGHGFLRQQDGRNGANMAATQQAWPMAVAWFHKYLSGR